MTVFENIVEFADFGLVVRAWIARDLEGPSPNLHHAMLNEVVRLVDLTHYDPLQIAISVRKHLTDKGCVVNALQVSNSNGQGSLEYQDWP